MFVRPLKCAALISLLSPATAFAVDQNPPPTHRVLSPIASSSVTESRFEGDWTSRVYCSYRSGDESGPEDGTITLSLNPAQNGALSGVAQLRHAGSGSVVRFTLDGTYNQASGAFSVQLKDEIAEHVFGDRLKMRERNRFEGVHEPSEGVLRVSSNATLCNRPAFTLFVKQSDVPEMYAALVQDQEWREHWIDAMVAHPHAGSMDPLRIRALYTYIANVLASGDDLWTATQALGAITPVSIFQEIAQNETIRLTDGTRITAKKYPFDPETAAQIHAVVLDLHGQLQAASLAGEAERIATLPATFQGLLDAGTILAAVRDSGNTDALASAQAAFEDKRWDAMATIGAELASAPDAQIARALYRERVAALGGLATPANIESMKASMNVAIAREVSKRAAALSTELAAGLTSLRQLNLARDELRTLQQLADGLVIEALATLEKDVEAASAQADAKGVEEAVKRLASLAPTYNSESEALRISSWAEQSLTGKNRETVLAAVDGFYAEFGAMIVAEAEEAMAASGTGYSVMTHGHFAPQMQERVRLLEKRNQSALANRLQKHFETLVSQTRTAVENDAIDYANNLAETMESAGMPVPPRPGLEIALVALADLAATDPVWSAAHDAALQSSEDAARDWCIQRAGPVVQDAYAERIVVDGQEMSFGALLCALHEANVDLASVDQSGLFGPGTVTVTGRDIAGQEDLTLTFEGAKNNGVVYRELTGLEINGVLIGESGAYASFLSTTVESSASGALGAREVCETFENIEATRSGTRLSTADREAIWAEYEAQDQGVARLGIESHRQYRSLMSNTSYLQTMCRTSLSSVVRK